MLKGPLPSISESDGNMCRRHRGGAWGGRLSASSRGWQTTGACSQDKTRTLLLGKSYPAKLTNFPEAEARPFTTMIMGKAIRYACLNAGIVVGTLGVAGFLQAAEEVRRLARAAGKKTYTLLMGKPNPAKLANFPEVDIFVMIADAQVWQPSSCLLNGQH